MSDNGGCCVRRSCIFINIVHSLHNYYAMHYTPSKNVPAYAKNSFFWTGKWINYIIDFIICHRVVTVPQRGYSVDGGYRFPRGTGNFGGLSVPLKSIGSCCLSRPASIRWRILTIHTVYGLYISAPYEERPSTCPIYMHPGGINRQTESFTFSSRLQGNFVISYYRTKRYGLRIQYDTVDLRSLKSWRDGQLSLAHGTEAKNKKKK